MSIHTDYLVHTYIADRHRAANWNPAIQSSVRSSSAATSPAVSSGLIARLRNSLASEGVKRRTEARAG